MATVKISLEEEKRLLALAKAGDQRAFNELMEHHYKYIWNCCKKYTDYVEDTEEAVQETMLKIFEHLKSFREGSRLSTWIFVIARHCAIANLSTRSRTPSHPHNNRLSHTSDDSFVDVDYDGYLLGEDFTEFGTNHTSPEDEIIAAELGNNLFDLIGQLPPDQQEALLLREIDLKHYDEISLETGVCLGTVKSRIYNAREKLDGMLREHYDAEERSNKRFTGIGSK
jgi:RNA polymerase sigma-70 factor (ECF subfamily)